MSVKDPMREKLLEAALPHVVFDGWSAETFRMACEDAGMAPEVAATLCPRGALDLATDYHRAGDAAMLEALSAEDLSELRFRDRIALAVRLRLEAADKEIVRRGSSLFALPRNAPDGARLIWGTADAIWRALGDDSQDANWYTKRATLSAVYASTVLYWLGDTSDGDAATWAFLDRRIGDVMRFEKTKAAMRKMPGVGSFLDRMQARLRAPGARRMHDVPGTWHDGGEDGSPHEQA